MPGYCCGQVRGAVSDRGIYVTDYLAKFLDFASMIRLFSGTVTGCGIQEFEPCYNEEILNTLPSLLSP